MMRAFVVIRTELQRNNGMIEVSAIEPGEVMYKPDSNTNPETLFLYMDPTIETIPMVGETLKVTIDTEVNNG